MKKLIVLSVIFALVAGSVFAADVSVSVQGGATLATGSSAQGADGLTSNGEPRYSNDYIGTGYGVGQVRIGASGETEDGVIGGWLRFDGSSGGPVGASGFVWWKPADIFKLQIGSNGGDGEFGLEGVTGWGFYQTAADVGVADHWDVWSGPINFRSAFFGGWNAPGIILTSVPVEALTINLGIPLAATKFANFDGNVGYDKNSTTRSPIPGSGSDYAYQNYKRFTLQVKYNIDGVGTAGITYVNSLFEHKGGGVMLDFSDPTKISKDYILPGGGANNDNPNIWAYFGLTSIENLGIDVGIGYKFADQYYLDKRLEVAGKLVGEELTWITNNPINIGVGANFSAGSFGVKAKVLASIGGSKEYDWKTTKADGTEDKAGTYNVKLADDTAVIIDVLPYYAVNETLTAYLGAGIRFFTGNEYIKPTLKDGVPEFDADGHLKYTIEVDQSSAINWYVNPYISINHGAGTFYAGFRLESPYGKNLILDKDGKEKSNDRVLLWSIPIGIAVSF